METNRLLFLILGLVLGFPLTLLQFYYFVKLRRTSFIRNRGYYSVLLTGFGFTMISLGVSLASVFDLPCIVGIIAVYFGAPLSALSFVERSVVLYFCFIITQQAEDLANEEFGFVVKNEDNKPLGGRFIQKFLLERRRYFSYRLGFFNPVRLIALSVSLLFSLIGILDLALVYPGAANLNWWDMECHRGALGGFKPPLICIYVTALLRIYVTVKIHKSQENFGIQRELKLMSLTIACIAGFLTYVIFWTDTAMKQLSDFITISYLPFAVVLPQVAIFVCFGMVLLDINSLVQKRKRVQSQTDVNAAMANQNPATPMSATDETGGRTSITVSRISTVQFKPSPQFQRVLEDQELLGLFQQFLVKEWSVENILFWRAVNTYEKQVGLALMKQESNPSPGAEDNDVGSDAEAAANFPVKWSFGRKIFAEFCTPTSRLSVNISHPQRVRLQTLFNRDDDLIADEQKEALLKELRDALRDCQREVMSLMQNDSFKRFKMTPEYQQAIRSDGLQ